MKKKYLFFIIVITTALLYFYIQIYGNAKKYETNYSKLHENLHMLDYLSPFTFIYTENNNEFPKSLRTCMNDPLDSAFIKYRMKDMFSNDNNDQLIYFPLYNNKSLKFDAYMIVSRGIDGKFNNVYDKNDTVLKSEIFDKFKFYNEYCWNDFDNYQICDSIANGKFNIIKYLFGKRDYLVFYLDYESNSLAPNCSKLTTE